ncbi:MAG: SDR family NAD(P)-dependent oxidoreductase, partial [Chloroflexi bacterium]|nr:SDR family NAD(P)-dependent oxidoreductase [Chloroflexota bacterium]
MILDRFSLAGKVAIVTGAGRGIGKGIALAYAEAGADVVCVARTASEIESVAARARSMGRRALAIPSSVIDGEQVQAFVDRTLQEFGRIDVLVNNVGGAQYRPIMQTSESAFLTVLRVNLVSTFVCSKAAAAVMLKQKSGSIINISSGDSKIPCPGMAP